MEANSDWLNSKSSSISKLKKNNNSISSILSLRCVLIDYLLCALLLGLDMHCSSLVKKQQIHFNLLLSSRVSNLICICPLEKGRIYSVGSNAYGALGIGEDNNNRMLWK